MNEEVIKNYSIHNEQVVLSCLMQNNKTLYRYIDSVKGEYFLDKKSKLILKGLKKLVSRKQKFSLDTLMEFLDDENISIKELQKLIDIYSSAHKNIEFHISKIVLNYCKLRSYNTLLNELDQTLLDSKSDKEDIFNIIDLFKDEFSIVQNALTEIGDGNEIFDNYLDTLDRRLEGKAFGTTGFKCLDSALTEGFCDGKITILGALRSIGKTTFCCNIANALISKGLPVIYFNLEPHTISILDQLVCMRLKISRTDLIKYASKLDDKILDEIEEEVYNITVRDNLLKFVDNPDVSFNSIENILSSNNYKLAIIDLFEKLKEVPSGDTKLISQALDRIQSIAKKTNTHILVVQQLNRATEKRKDIRPKLSDFMNTSKYEQVADNVFLLHRNKFFEPELIDDILEVIIAKQREGKPNVNVYFKFLGEIAKIEEMGLR